MDQQLHSTEREAVILEMLQETGFVTFKALDSRLKASPATLRRDLGRMERSGQLVRIRGGARSVREFPQPLLANDVSKLSGVPFHQNIRLHLAQKQAIGRAAAALCRPGESIIIDGGSTTLQMCPHIDGLQLQVLSNSLHIIDALLPQTGTRIALPAGTMFREQNIILSPFDEDGMRRYRASRMFMGAASLGPHGVMQTDVILAQSEQRMLERADELILLVDSSKFEAPAGHVVCALEDVDMVITDNRISENSLRLLERASVRVVIAEAKTHGARTVPADFVPA